MKTLRKNQFNKNAGRRDSLSSYCRRCSCKYYRRFYKENRIKLRPILRAQSRRMYKKHKHKRILESRLYRKKYPWKIKAYNKKYYWAHRSEGHQRVEAWYRANPESKRIKEQRRYARKLRLPNTLTIKEWKRICSAFGNECTYCGRRGKMHQDHLIPVALGGGYTKRNIVPACKHCNSSKRDKHPKDWIGKKKFLVIVGKLRRANAN
jgi:hypothetical protein